MIPGRHPKCLPFKDEPKCPFLLECKDHSGWWVVTYCKDRFTDCAEYLNRMREKRKVE